MIRILCREEDNNACAAGVGQTETSYKTFDIDAPTLEEWLSRRDSPNAAYLTRSIIGVEVQLQQGDAPKEEKQP